MAIYKNDDTRKNILEGAEVLYDAVKTTLGPRGRNVLIRDKFGTFTITHDGVTVAKAVQLKDDPKSIGVEIIKEASKKMDLAGDGTTTVTVLTYHLIKEAYNLIVTGFEPMEIKRTLEARIPEIIEEIDKRSRKIEKNFAEVRDVAVISTGSDSLGEMVAELISEVGFDGAVSVEVTKSPETTAKVVEGYSFDRGYMSPHFVTDQASREAVLRNPAVILVNGVVSDLQDYSKLIEVLFEKGIKNVLMVAETFEAEALNTLILNKLKNVITIVPVKTPGYGAQKLEYLKDLAAVTGGKVIDPNVAEWQDELTIEVLGAGEKITVGVDETIIFSGKGHVAQYKERLQKRMRKLKEDERPALEERIAKLTGSVGLIRVGGQTDTEAEEEKYRIDDAVASVKAAMKGGIVAGGGVTLENIAVKYIRDSDQVLQALGMALIAPMDILLNNSGYNLTDYELPEGKGVDVRSGTAVDMLYAGIIDPADITKEVVRNGIATACLAITVGGSIVEQQLTREEMAALMGGGNV